MAAVLVAFCAAVSMEVKSIDEIDTNPLTKTRTIKVKKVEWYLIIGSTQVEKKEWPGSTIPIVPLLGEETVIDGQYGSLHVVLILIE